MNKFPLLVILVFIGASAFAQTQTEKEVKDLLPYKWKVTHMEQGGQKMEIPAGFGDTFLDIKADGSIVMIDPEKEEKGKWTYDHKSKVLTTITGEDSQKLELVKISDAELVIKVSEEGMTLTMYLKRTK